MALGLESAHSNCLAECEALHLPGSPFVRPEGRSGKMFPVAQVRLGGLVPSEPDGDRLGYLGAGNHNGAALYFSFGVDKLFVGSRNLEPRQRLPIE